jgi:uncharacterized protein YkwD
MFDARLPLLAATALAISVAATPVAQARKVAHATQAADCGAVDARPGEVSTPAIRSATLCLLNIERHERGKSDLRSNATLGKVATRYSHLMVDDGFFDHVSPSGSSLTTRVRKTIYLRGAHSWALGENLAWGTGHLATPRETVAGWMNSPGHRANILNGRFRDIGIGVVEGTPSANADGATYTTNFGRRS